MPRMPYRAIDSTGQPIEDVVDADTAQDALSALRERGLTQIELQQDAATTVMPDGEAFRGTDPAEITRIERAMQRDAGLWAVWRQVLRGARWWLGFALLLLGYGLFASNGFLTILGAAMLVLPFMLSGLSYRHAARYEAFLRAFAFGRREEMQRLSALLVQAIKDPGMRFDLAMRRAEFIAREQGIASALAQVEPFRQAMEQRSPALFPARVATLHLAAGDPSGFVRQMREAWELSGQEAGRAMDAALAEARCGDAARAHELLGSIDETELAPMSRIFRDWIVGLLSERDNADGRAALSRAVEGFTAHARMPAVWSALAACTCDYALALARHGDLAHGDALTRAVWPVAGVHLDAATRTRIEHTFFAGNAPAIPER